MTELGNPGTVFGDSTRLSFANKTFSKKELVMLGGCLVALVMCIVFAGLYANKEHNNGASAAANSGGPATALPLRMEVCQTPECLEIAADVSSYMNTSTKPCDNFHNFACGMWSKENPLKDGDYRYSPTYKIYGDNREKLRNLLEDPPVDTDSDAEKKLKNMFMSCLNLYGKMDKGGNPFIQKVLSKVGGWTVFGNFDSANWNLQTTLQKIHVDFWTNVLFKFYVTSTWQNRAEKVILIHDDGTTMYPFYYSDAASGEVRQHFRKFLKNVAGLLVRDARITIPEEEKNTRVNTFVEDVLMFEGRLANFSNTHAYDTGFFNDEERVTLAELTTQTNNAIDWISFFQYMFSGANINGNTRVMITKKQYIIQMSNYINSLGANKTRILNNYFVWSLAFNYLQDLSWEYVHANREFYVDRTGRTEFLGTWRYCFNYVSRKMDVALSHLFVKDHFADDNKLKVQEIATYVKASVADHVDTFNWMDGSTKTYAKNKVKNITDKLGYPDFIMNADKVDAIYASLEINETDYFQNILNMNKFEKADLTSMLTSGEDRSKWFGTTYSSFAYLYPPWNELLIPAGILQWPFYDYHIPHYLNFGSMGSIMAHRYLHAIDEYGSVFQINGSQIRNDEGKAQSWWSPGTKNSYNNSKQCFVQYYQNKTLGPFNIFGRKISFNADGKRLASEAALEQGGLKQAYYAYKKWEREHNGEPVTPGLGFTNDQMFFISYAQTLCYVQTEMVSYAQARRGYLPDNFRVNTAVSQMKEFSDAFRCAANSPMNPTKKCALW